MKKIGLFFLGVLFLATMNAQVVGYTSSDTYLRSGPDSGSEAIIKLPEGTKIDLPKQYDGEWIPIEYNGIKLFLHSGSLSSKNPTSNRSTNDRGTSSKKNPVPTGSRSYINSRGKRVQSPTHYSSKPRGASAKCKDGTYSFSRSRRGTCSGHGGVAKWY